MALYVHSIETLGALDGPGLRTVVFLKGCPLRCAYCHNPDTWFIDANARQTADDELLKRILRMKPYFKNGGGVTFSGGEPLLQADALIPFLKRLKAENVHVTIDTSGAIWNARVAKLIDLSDLVLLDLKHSEAEAYENLTGGDLSITLQVLDYIKSIEKPYWIRHVVIPELTDSIEHLRRIDALTQSSLREKLDFLPYHRMGIEKWHKLSRVSPIEATPELSQEDLKKLLDCL